MGKILDLRKEEQSNQENPVNNLKSISWKAAADQPHPLAHRNRFFFMIGLIIAALFLIIFRINYLLAVLLILSSVVIALRQRLPHQDKDVRIDPTGVTINNEKHYYHDIHSFWLDFRPGESKDLSIKFKKVYAPPIRLSLGDANPLDVRALMISYVPEKEHQISLTDVISRKLGL